MLPRGVLKIGFAAPLPKASLSFCGRTRRSHRRRRPPLFYIFLAGGRNRLKYNCQDRTPKDVYSILLKENVLCHSHKSSNWPRTISCGGLSLTFLYIIIRRLVNVKRNVSGIPNSSSCLSGQQQMKSCLKGQYTLDRSSFFLRIQDLNSKEMKGGFLGRIKCHHLKMTLASKRDLFIQIQVF